ncbi:hypothetical protein PV04_05660 [Phialophora macrospora]|uniref:Cytochrome oxidase c assembly-domain-containing protein n=1 Tax=Phialophora macrospora TaxID=1851006 RepID=A0A0D2G2I4_9EURO|nr:hypothetical protein PV04_05660 [Phialophora macrospora]
MKTFSFNMARRPPADTFTRFTSTTPHATTFTYQPSSRPTSRPTPSSSPSPSSQPPSSQPPNPQSQPPTNETPMEKVARLRAAHRANLASQNTSTFDRLISSGRNIADRAHRLTAYGLILFSGLAVCVTAYGTVSLIAHSRRQKRAWIERELDRLDEARKAFLRGDATAEQLHLLEQERAGQEMEAARMKEAEKKKSESVWGRVKGLVGGQLAKGEMGEESAQEREKRLTRKQRGVEEGWIDGEVRPVASASSAHMPGSIVRTAVQVAPSEIPGVGIDSKGRPVPAGRIEYLARKVEEEPTTGGRSATVRAGGPLDVMASNVAGAVAGSSSTEGKSWLSWIRGSSSSKSSE